MSHERHYLVGLLKVLRAVRRALASLNHQPNHNHRRRARLRTKHHV